jgi:hypothetical protein
VPAFGRSFIVTPVCLSFGPIRQNFTASVTEAYARRPGAAASASRRRRERRNLLAGGGRRASRSQSLGASQAFKRMHMLFCHRVKHLGTRWYEYCDRYAEHRDTSVRTSDSSLRLTLTLGSRGCQSQWVSTAFSSHERQAEEVQAGAVRSLHVYCAENRYDSRNFVTVRKTVNYSRVGGMGRIRVV